MLTRYHLSAILNLQLGSIFTLRPRDRDYLLNAHLIKFEHGRAVVTTKGDNLVKLTMRNMNVSMECPTLEELPAA